MKSEGPELLFKLRGDRTPEEWGEMRDRAGREVAAALANSPAFQASAALGSIAFDLTHMRGAFAAECAPALKAIADMGRQIGAAFAEITRPDGYLAQVVRQAEEARASFAEWFATLPKEEREEIRRAYADAPPCEVDVNANGSGVM